MPLAFDAIPGLAGNPLVLARREHDVTASGASVALAAWIPELKGIAGAAPNTFLFKLWRIQWLLLAIIRPSAALPRARLLVECMVHVQRLGVAFEACVAGGLNLAPVSASVGRKLLRRKAAVQRADDVVQA